MNHQSIFSKQPAISALFVMIVVFGAIPDSLFVKQILAQEPDQVKEVIFREIREQMNKAEAEDIATYAPNNFARANEFFQEAIAGYERGNRLEDIQRNVDQAGIHLKAAFKSAQIVKENLENLLAARQEAIRFEAEEQAAELFDRAEEIFRKAVTLAEAGDLEAARPIAQNAETEYRGASLISLREVFINEERLKLEEISERITVEEYDESKQELENAEAFLELARSQGIFASEFLELMERVKWQTIGAPALPDLTVELYDVPYSQIKGIDPFPALIDRPTILSVLMKNVGLASVDKNFITEFYLDGNLAKVWTFSPISGEEDPQHAQNPLQPGGNRIYDYEVTFSAGGIHTLRWVVDAQDDITESDESSKSNILDTTVVWQAAPDLIVADIWPVSPAVGGQKSTWKIKVNNIGAGGVDRPFLTTFWPDVAGGSQENFWLPSLAAGGGVEFATTQSFQVSGKRTFRAIVDVGNRVHEARPNGELNNELVKQFDLAPVDLVIENLTINPANPIAGAPVTFSFMVKNLGAGNAALPFKVRVFPGLVTPQGTTQSILLTVNGLPAGQAINLQHTVKMRPGKQQVSINADFPNPDPVYFENDRNNNVLVKEIQVPGYLNALSYYLGESIYINTADSAEQARDQDGDLLKDDLEGKLAEAFSPFYKFDSDEKSRRPFEPVTLFQVRPRGCAGLGCSGKTEILIRWVFLFMFDGGYGPDSWEGKNSHKGDNDRALYELTSSDGGFTWTLKVVTLADWHSHALRWPGGYIVPYQRVGRPVTPWTPTYMELNQQHHPVIYMSAHKHHMYFGTGWNHKDSYYSKWYLNDDVNGKGAAIPANLHSVFMDKRYNNVGEPEKGGHSAAYFVNCMTDFPRLMWTSPAIAGNAECNNMLFSAWGSTHFYNVGPNADLWLTNKECQWQPK